jgi:hypothetical protein
MSKTICGHDRETLRWALQLPEHPIRAFDALTFSEARRRAPSDAHVAALYAAHDPAKLAAIIAELARERGVSAERVDFDKRFESLANVAIFVDNGAIAIETGDALHTLTMTQGRAFALKLLDAPIPGTCAQCGGKLEMAPQFPSGYDFHCSTHGWTNPAIAPDIERMIGEVR